MMPTNELPEDPSLPGLAAIRSRGLPETVPGLQLTDPVELRLCGYSRGLRATLEARSRGDRFAVKCYAQDPAAEAGLYETLALAGLTAVESDVRVPRLLAWKRELRILAISWLEGPTASELITAGQGERAGELAARWFQRAASFDADLRPSGGAGEVLSRARRWTAALGAASASIGTAAGRLAGMLAASVQEEPVTHVVNGRLYARHVIDIGSGPGVIDWEHFGRGPLEIDAGMFLATLWRSGRHDDRARAAARAEEEFLGRTACLLDERLVAWHRAGALFSLAHHLLARRKGDWPERAGEFLREAERSLKTAACLPPAARSARAGLLPRVAVIVDAPLPGVPVETQTRDESPADAAALPVPNPGERGRPAVERPGHEGPRSPWLSELDLSLLRALWARGEATAYEVSATIDVSLDRARVARRLGRLERKGVVTRRIVRRGGVYRAAVDQAAVQRSVVENFASYTEALFEGDLASLVCQLVRARDVDARNLERVIALLKAREPKAEGAGE